MSAARLVQSLEDLQRVEHGAHAHVVRHAAVDEVEIGPMDTVAEGCSALSERIARAAGRGGLSASRNGLAHAGGVELQVPP